MPVVMIFQVREELFDRKKVGIGLIAESVPKKKERK